MVADLGSVPIYLCEHRQALALGMATLQEPRSATQNMGGTDCFVFSAFMR